jgi:hypothetical protein
MHPTFLALADVRKLQIIEAHSLISLTKYVKFDISKGRKRKYCRELSRLTADKTRCEHDTQLRIIKYSQVLNVSRGFSALSSATTYCGIGVRLYQSAVMR